ncbi:hypothetical protein [Actinokineospora sp. NBRC 105648]|uniref:hypothetical protein n=1 Tax=Actinokineospora sp. NBRC 105648 TaxID=3032206 RepID=UPI0024A146C5|nr:hypothetical protein [Actinokineospora sp. NBRC 105648]GLZ39736.1 hypothetical protein Acsp05_33600 [Actinokineospora sp. NBRC 105648]
MGANQTTGRGQRSAGRLVRAEPVVPWPRPSSTVERSTDAGPAEVLVAIDKTYREFASDRR